MQWRRFLHRASVVRALEYVQSVFRNFHCSFTISKRKHDVLQNYMTSGRLWFVEAEIYFHRLSYMHRGVNSYLKLGGQPVMRRAAAAPAPSILLQLPSTQLDLGFTISMNDSPILPILIMNLPSHDVRRSNVHCSIFTSSRKAENWIKCPLCPF